VDVVACLDEATRFIVFVTRLAQRLDENSVGVEAFA